MRIRITKRAAVTGGLPPRDMDDHIPGQAQPQTFSLPIEYWAEGEAELPKVGQCFTMLREIRNGIMVPGILQTTTLTEVTDKTFNTKNSVYEYEVLTTGEQTV